CHCWNKRSQPWIAAPGRRLRTGNRSSSKLLDDLISRGYVETMPGSGPVYWVLSPRLLIVTPKTGASANQTSLKGRLPVPPVCVPSDPSVTFRYVPPFTLVFLPPKIISGMFCWL